MKQLVTAVFALFIIMLALPRCVAQGDMPALQLHGALPIPVEHEPVASSLDVSAGQEWHRATLRLYGSMCPACLLELQGKLRKLDGVKFATVDYRANVDPAVHNKKTAPTVIIYDSHAIQWSALQHFFSSNYFKCLGVKDELFSDRNALQQPDAAVSKQ